MASANDIRGFVFEVLLGAGFFVEVFAVGMADPG
jgi:hypothetical protein